VKSVVALADLHCGHRAGLTPPEWQWPVRNAPPARAAWGVAQREAWKAYTDIRKSIGSPDLLIVVGDLIDGRGESSGSTELIAVDRLEQCEMAQAALDVWGAKRTVIARGTAYHSGDMEEYEDLIAHGLGAEIDTHPFIQVENVVFDVKHRISGSQVPYGRYTALARDRVWNVLWAERDEAPKAQVILRAHVHYFAAISGRGWTAMILPALQLGRTRHGETNFSGTVDWGLVQFTVEGGGHTWREYTRGLRANARTLIHVP